MKTIAVGALLMMSGALAEDLRNEPIEKDLGRFAERLMKAVPRGSAMQEAIEFVEARGFTNCTAHENKKWSSQFPAGDFVQCEREYAGTYYEVALFHRGRSFQTVGLTQRPASGRPK